MKNKDEINWLNYIIELQGRVNSRIANSGATPWALVITTVGLLYFLINNFSSIFSNSGNVSVLILTYAMICNLTKPIFDLINAFFRKEKLFKLHNYKKNKLDRKYFWLLKPLDILFVITMIFANGFTFLYLVIDFLTKVYFGIFAIYYLFVFIINIVLFMGDLLPEEMKNQIDREIETKKRNNKGQEISLFKIWPLVAIGLSIIIIINKFSEIVEYFTVAIAPIVYSMQLYAFFFVIELSSLVIASSMKIAKLKEIENRALRENLSNKQIGEIVKKEILDGSNLDGIFD